MPAAHFPLALLLAVAFLSPTPSFAQLNVITSVGFEAVYNELIPVFQKSSGITVSTKHFASQGSGPDTIAAQLGAGAAADVVVLSKEGLGGTPCRRQDHPSKRGGPAECLHRADVRFGSASADRAQSRLGVAAHAASLKIDQCAEQPQASISPKSASEARYRGRGDRQDQRRDFGDRCHRRGRDCNSPRE
jgi:hypothetical protein